MIYFIQAEDGGPIKIGTTIRLSQRLKQLAAESGGNLRVLAVADGSHEGERALHGRFAHLRVAGEWFEPGDDLIGFIVTDAREWDGTDEAPLSLVSVKMDSTVVDDAKIVASYKKLSLAEYLSEVLRPIVARQLEEEHAKRVQPPKGKAKGPGAN